MIRVLIADDHPAVRVGLERLVKGEPGLVLVGSAATAGDGVEEANRAAPDCAVVDYHLPGGGLDLCWRLKGLSPSPGVVMYSAFAGDGLAVVARLAGADALLDKAAPADAIFESIRRVAKGGCSIEPPRDALVRGSQALEAEDLPIYGMLVDGTPRCDIAETLNLEWRELEERVGRMLARVEQRMGIASASPAAPQP